MSVTQVDTAQHDMNGGEIPAGTGNSSSIYKRGRYTSRGEDRHPHIFPSQVLLFPSKRPGRITSRKSIDPHADCAYGDAIIYKDPRSTRFMFQNVKGLTITQSGDDFNYYLSSMLSYAVDVFGMAETNVGWQHQHIQASFRGSIRRQLKVGKVTFGSPSHQTDPLGARETFQAGGVLQVVRGNLTTTVFGSPIQDTTGLGRWSGFTLIGKSEQKLSVITGYRTCRGSIASSPLGSSYHREYVFFKERGYKSPQPRKHFIDDLAVVIRHLQDQGHSILLMMDANSVLELDNQLTVFLESHDLRDLHFDTPASSTYINSDNRRIDFMFGCPRTMAARTRQGTLSYFEGPQSDHRALYVDLCLSQLLGTESFDQVLPTGPSRWLRSGNPESVTIYVEQLHKYYATHRMKERIDQLWETHQTLTRSQVRRLLTAWDEDQGRAMRAAESQLATPPKLYKWSPRLRNAGVIFRYWKLRLRELTHSEDYSMTFARWERQIQFFDSSFTLPYRSQALEAHEVRRHLNNSHKELRQVQKKSTEHRVGCYEELLSKYEADDNPSTKKESQRLAKQVARTIKGEEDKRLFGKLRQILNPTEYSSLTQIQVPRYPMSDEPTTPGKVHDVLQQYHPDQLVWDTIISRADIEAHLLQFNREAFRAAAESPCGSGVIHDALTFTSLSDEAEACLRGEIPHHWHGDDNLLREFLSSFQIPNSVMEAGPINLEITNSDIVKGFTSWKEATTTSPSGRHLGHYKALITDPILLDCLRKFLNIAISRGIAIPRWCKAVNVMIEKDPGSPRINRLRIIHLFEADYNLFLKIMWGSRLVRRSVELNLLHDGQHGSVPGRTTMDPVMLNQLTTDLCRLLKVNYARFDNDASACFDRIIVALGMMAARRCGMPTAAVRTHAKALELMTYMVKTVYGISEASYRGTVMEPLFGTGQGSGASPAVWLSLVVILLNTLERVIPNRISFRSPDGNIIHQRLVDAFVDDTAIGLTDDGEASLAELTKALESVAQTWEQLLHFSGGSLNLKKCSWYVLFWEWKQGRPCLREMEPGDPGIELYQGSQSSRKVSIRQQHHTTSSRILGVHQTPMGDFSDHIRVLKKKADQYAGYLRSPRLTTSDVRVFHRSIYSPAMRYSLPAIAVDEEELNSIQSKILPTIVQRMGMSSKLPTAIRHGPKSMGGLDLIDLRTECGIEMIKYFRHEVYANTNAGQLLLLQLQASQLESGLPIRLLEEPHIHIPYLTPTWILSMRQFMSNHNIRITLTDNFNLELQGRNDQYIMDLSRLKGYSVRQQTDLNLVRLYLQVTTIAELTDTHESNKIAEWALEAQRSPQFIDARTWPRQQVVSPSQRRLWKRYVSSQFLRYGRFWKMTPRGSLRELSETKKSLAGTATSGPFNLSKSIRSLPRGRRRLLSHTRVLMSESDLWRECQKKQTLTIASDGGLKGRKGTFGWLISTKSRSVLAEGAGPVDGPFDTVNSTRCELGGLTAPLIFLSLLHSLWGKRHKCTFRWVTDSKAAIAKVIKQNDNPHTKRRQPSNADLLGIIQAEKRLLRRKVRPVWVKGHQVISGRSRQRKDIADNNRADQLATWYRSNCKFCQSIEYTEHTPEARVTISVNGIRLVGQEEATLRYHINGYHLRQYIQSRQRWTNKVWDSIDFEVFGRFYCKLNPQTQLSHSKFIFDQWYTGVKRARVSQTNDVDLDLCPCCKQHGETTDHILQCTANPEHDKSVRELGRRLSLTEYHPIFPILKASIMAWLKGEVYSPDIDEFPRKLQDRIRKALNEQERIGWNNAIKGYLSVEWRLLADLSPYGNTCDEQEGKGFRVLTTILNNFQQTTQRLWKARNHVLHTSTEEHLRCIRDAQTVEIRAMYANPESIQAGDRHYCERSLESILKKSTATRRRWLRYMRLSRERMSREGSRQLLMTQFYRPVSTAQ
jgi:hypothetical protein